MWPVFVFSEILDASGSCSHGTTETTPSSNFNILENGSIVLDTVTGLEWQRCVLGMDWNNQTCEGFATYHTWHSALLTAEEMGNGWRVPNRNELESIVERCRINPSINIHAFPNTPNDVFWTSSHSALVTSNAWHVVFGNNFDDHFLLPSGSHGWGAISNRHKVRLVRNIQNFEPNSGSEPTPEPNPEIP